MIESSNYDGYFGPIRCSLMCPTRKVHRTEKWCILWKCFSWEVLVATQPYIKYSLFRVSKTPDLCALCFSPIHYVFNAFSSFFGKFDEKLRPLFQI